MDFIPFGAYSGLISNSQFPVDKLPLPVGCEVIIRWVQMRAKCFSCTAEVSYPVRISRHAQISASSQRDAGLSYSPRAYNRLFK